jgi:hypothetical protein
MRRADTRLSDIFCDIAQHDALRDDFTHYEYHRSLNTTASLTARSSSISICDEFQFINSHYRNISWRRIETPITGHYDFMTHYLASLPPIWRLLTNSCLISYHGFYFIQFRHHHISTAQFSCLFWHFTPISSFPRAFSYFIYLAFTPSLTLLHGGPISFTPARASLHYTTTTHWRRFLLVISAPLERPRCI